MPRSTATAPVRFAASHGVLLGDPAAPLAHFQRDEELDTAEGERRYSFTTEDPDVASALRAIEDYGITEIKG